MKILPPDSCPSCNYKLELVKAQLFCRNVACSAQIAGKLHHFAKVLGIKGLGPVAIQKLNLQEVTEVFYLERTYVVDVLGEKTADKLLTEIERCKSADLATVLAAFAIPLIGGTASAKIAGVVSSIEEIDMQTCKQAGLGNVSTENLLNWVNTDYIELKGFLPFSFKKRITVNANAETVCITGKLSSVKTKAEAYRVLEAAGYKIVELVNKTTNYLLDESGKESAKFKQAEKLGIPIITSLNDLIKKETHD